MARSREQRIERAGWTLLLLLAPSCSVTVDARGDGDGGDGHDHVHTHPPVRDGSAPPHDHDHVPPVADSQAPAGAYAWPLPPGFPVPKVPDDNPLTLEKIELGRHLFYDTRLSLNETQSCASCHEQARAFSDGRARGVGSTGEVHPRGPMSLVNVAYAATLTWANPVVKDLERQVAVPLFGEAPVELGFSGREDELLSRLRAEPRYAVLFGAAFPDEVDPITILNVTRGIASFERALVSGRSPYDRHLAGEALALTEAQKRGLELFVSERTECSHCHGGFALTDSVTFTTKAFDETPFHNTGLYNIGGDGSFPEANQGLFLFTEKPSDMGRFKAPTLRNIAVTAPYMHDGSIATLDGVLDHYAAGGRTIESGELAGVGSQNPYKDQLVAGFTLTSAERADLLAFFDALTDTELLGDPRLSDPWVR